ncbi:zeta toxin family protein [Micromonosporaceae bacterium DT194]|uniref:zeta toxin family protein n=1 Tax=Melissospora conviva TaxID=3388432 RepID=UPI003C188486
MTQPDPTKYLLSAEQADEIFHRHVVPTMLAGAVPQEEPFVIVLTAQPGAGKSTLGRDIREEFSEQARPVIVDVDAFRPFYPNYAKINEDFGLAAGQEITQEDARRWFGQALTYLAEHRVNVIAEHGLRDRTVTDDLLSRFAQESGGRPPYRVEVAYLATPAAQSRLGILARYQTGLEHAGFGRYVSEELHDARYQHVVEAAGWLDADSRVTAVSVYQRGSATPVHRNERGPDGSWSLAQPTGAAITAQREQPWSLPESRQFLRLHHSLSARMTPDWRHLLHEARVRAEPLLDPTAETPRHDKPAVTFGRYQIVSIAHLDTVRTILMDWPTLEVGVLDLEHLPNQRAEIPEHLQQFYRDCEANVAPEKNPMSAEERAGFWRATIAEAGLQDRVSVRVIPRPELDPAGFNRQYPADRFDVVFPTVSGEGFDRIRNDAFQEILGRPVLSVDPPLEYHTSDIRAAYREGNAAWKRGFAPGSLNAFIRADGPRRLLDASRSTDSSRAARTAVQAFPSATRAGSALRPRQAPEPAVPPAHAPKRGHER